MESKREKLSAVKCGRTCKFKNSFKKLLHNKKTAKIINIQKESCHNFDVKEWTLHKWKSSYNFICISDLFYCFNLLISTWIDRSYLKGENSTHMLFCLKLISVPLSKYMPVGWGDLNDILKYVTTVFLKTKNG